jgi:myosin-5
MYTSSGPILIAINPCRMVKALYDESTMNMYQSHGEQLANGSSGSSNNKTKKQNGKVSSSSSSSSSPPPHVFAVADSAYRGMMRGLDFARDDNNDSFTEMEEKKKESSTLSNQSILVSGESGAGKTVTTKFLMQYLADLSRKVHSDHAPNTAVEATGNNEKSSIEQRVLNSNPILEAFGNARTLRNDNSSRFGKFIEMRFSDRGRLLGAYIDTYLLEKARIVGHTCGEQTYHIFYELLAQGSLTEAMRRKLMIENLSTSDFAITTSDGGKNNSKLVHNEYDDHCKMFQELRSAMDTLSFSQSEQMEIFQVVCALLHLSNLTLKDGFVDINDGEECKLNENNVSLKRALSLLGVTYEALDSAVTRVQFKAVDELVTKNLSTSQATRAVQALIKGVYDSIFTILVGRINSCIAGVSDQDSNGGAFIGLLDIFGFETFKKNVFEQFCINYCNESLQQQFNRFVFKLEQQEYIREGIRWDMIEFQDNQDTLDLIEKRNSGILTILDEQCRLGMRCNDKTFVSAVYDKCMSGNTRFGADRKQKSQGKFTIRHYAGIVEYSTDGFMEKNKDEIPMEASELLSQSTCAFVRDIAGVISTKTNGSQKENKSSISRVSVGKQFSGQLQKLRRRIDETHPHYVRCIKPNEQLQPNHFDSNIVVDQLRCGGILEAIRVSRAGFPQRYSFEHFIARFSVISSAVSDKPKVSCKVGRANRGAHKKRKAKTQADTKAECQTLVKLISQWILDEREKNKAADDDTPHPEPSAESLSPRSFWKNQSDSKNSAIDLSAAGIQVGATKVFLIQDTFDIIERLRGQVTMANATKIASVIRMYLARKAYILMLKDYRQARGQIRAMFEAHSSSPHPKKCIELDENMLNKVISNVEGFEIISHGERAKSTNTEPTDFIWLSIGHGRFVKKVGSGEEITSVPPAEVDPSAATSFTDQNDHEKLEVSTEQQSKPESIVSQLVLNLQGDKDRKITAPISPMAFWGSQMSPRAHSDGNIGEAKKTAASSKNNGNNNPMKSESFSASKKPPATQARSFWSNQTSPRAHTDDKQVSPQEAAKPGLTRSKSEAGASKTTDTDLARSFWGSQVSPRAFGGDNSVKRTDTKGTQPQNDEHHQARSFWDNRASPRAFSDGKIEFHKESKIPSRTNGHNLNPKVAADSIKLNINTNPTYPRVSTVASQSQRAKTSSYVVPKAHDFSQTHPIKGATNANKPSSQHSFAAFDHSSWQKPSVPSQKEVKPKINFHSQHGKSGSGQRGESEHLPNNSREARQDSSTQHSFNAFDEPILTDAQFHSFQKIVSTSVEKHSSPVSYSNHSGGQQSGSVAARRRAKAKNAGTMIDNMTSSYKHMQIKPIQPVAKPTAPALAPPPLSSSARARRNMKQKMQRKTSNLDLGSFSESRSGSFSDYADF